MRLRRGDRCGNWGFCKSTWLGRAAGVEKPVSILRSGLRPTGGGCWPLRHASAGIAKVAPLRSESRVAILLPRNHGSAGRDSTVAPPGNSLLLRAAGFLACFYRIREQIRLPTSWQPLICLFFGEKASFWGTSSVWELYCLRSSLAGAAGAACLALSVLITLSRLALA